MRVHLIAAARPNFMKIAPLYHVLTRSSWCEPAIVHTGQHYDPNMSDAFFRDLSLPVPHHHLEVGSGSHAQQTAGVMVAYESAVARDRPDVIVVVGDVNSTMACAIVGTKCWIPVVHLEAGLRSGDRRMPEEINRLVTDAISDVLWTPSADADANLLGEGVAREKIDLVGNIMIDSLIMMQPAIDRDATRESMGLQRGAYAVATLHRPSNVDDAGNLRKLVTALVDVAERLPLVFPVHPRTRQRLAEFGLLQALQGHRHVLLSEPLGYVSFMNLVKDCRLAVTDSGGIQEETTFLGIPCLTLRENTERPVTITLGTNRLVRVEELGSRVGEVLAGRWPKGQCPPLWDGSTAERCASSLRRRFAAA